MSSSLITGPAKIDLRLERMNRGHSFRSLARACDVDKVAVKRAEEGLPISVTSAYAIATYLGLKVSEVWNLDGDQAQGEGHHHAHRSVA